MVLNFNVAEAATITGKKKNAPSPMMLSSCSVVETLSNTPAIARIIASNLTIEPPIMSGINGYMVPISASRIPAPTRLSDHLRGAGRPPSKPGVPRFINA
ncbi:hypothetical protein SGGMMB4_03169 [Sodalis glossinidius str. 'morsitans']|uniref:Uncharacterized protein n=1 Tax=Sodalis glossinidius (strain morsitans) TaxID=343509 RepID=A0A193QKJ3_SODGM|nr:hypothetical protein SGGMMB4_03169 [Sodalis glossinidius str. 'morsitans']